MEKIFRFVKAVSPYEIPYDVVNEVTSTCVHKDSIQYILKEFIKEIPSMLTGSTSEKAQDIITDYVNGIENLCYYSRYILDRTQDNILECSQNSMLELMPIYDEIKETDIFAISGESECNKFGNQMNTIDNYLEKCELKTDAKAFWLFKKFFMTFTSCTMELPNERRF